MTRLDLLKILVGQARTNGFEFRRWFTTRLALPWKNADAAFGVLDKHRQYYALLFSHEFAMNFWKSGEPITFQVPAQTFQRRMADGSIGTVHRKAFIRRSARPDAWRYHLREMALAEEPLRYMRRYLRIEEHLQDPDSDTPDDSSSAQSVPPATPPTLALARKAHERRQLALAAKTVIPNSKRGPRLPGSRKSS